MKNATTMKRIMLALAALVCAASFASAQDMAVATETYNNGVMALQGGDKSAALSYFTEALSLGQACGDEGAELVTNCKNAIPGIILSIAKGQINDGAYDDAIKTLDEAAAKAKEYGVDGIPAEAAELTTNAYLRKGTSLLKEKDMAGAAGALEKVVAADPTNGNASLMLGQALMGCADLDGAIEAFKVAAANGKADQANKMLGNIYLKQGQALLKGGKNAEAIEAFQTANSYVENPASYKLIASAYSKLGKTSASLEAYKKYLELNPTAKDAAGVKLTIAATAQKAGDKATAIEYYQQIVGDAQYGATAKQQLEVLKK